MLKRKIYDYLLNWKNNKVKECLLIKGARQVGKTFIVEEFGKNEYASYIYLNFYENPNLKNIFEGSLVAEDIYKKMSVFIPNINLIEKKTLIFLDEIQECPNARTALKFLALDDKYDFISSGSLLGIGYKDIASIPVGYEKQITMYPLDFEEFLWANGVNEFSIDYIKSFYDKQEKIEDGLNKQMFEKLKDYIVVGGMPAVVNTFLNEKNYTRVQEVQDEILNSYYDDIIKYADNTEKPKIRNCYQSIPRQLAKENKKFQYSEVEKKSSARKFENSLQWLEDANLVNICYNVSIPTLPLNAYQKNNFFKIYLNDIGLLCAMYGYETKYAILTNTLIGQAKGGIYENLICDILTKKGYKLHYYKRDDSSQEIEFLIQKQGQVIPIEVKAGNNSTESLNNFIKDFNPPYAFKFVNGNIGKADKKITLPLYMAMFI